MNMNRFFTPIFKLVLLLTASLALACAPAWAQLQSKVIVVNGGRYESVPPFADSVSVAVYDPVTKQYEVKHTIPDQSVQDLEIVGDTAIVVTDGGISTYKLPGLEPISRNGGVKGIRNIIAVGSKLYASRGFGWLPGEAFVYVFDRNTLLKTGEVTGIPTECDDIIYGGGKIYVSMPGEFGSDTGSLVQINPTTNSAQSILRFQNQGEGISRLAYANNKVYAFIMAGSGSAAGFIRYTPSSGLIRYFALSTKIGYEPSTIVGNTIYGSFSGAVSKFGFTDSLATIATPIRTMGYAGIAVDTLRRQLYVTSADFISPAKLYTMNHSGDLIDSLTVGIAPEKLGVFYYNPTGVKKPVELAVALNPNPASQWLHVRSERRAAYRILDPAGREHKAGMLDGSTPLDIAGLAPGLYQLVLQSGQGYAVRRFVKI